MNSISQKFKEAILKHIDEIKDEYIVECLNRRISLLEYLLSISEFEVDDEYNVCGTKQKDIVLEVVENKLSGCWTYPRIANLFDENNLSQLESEIERGQTTFVEIVEEIQEFQETMLDAEIENVIRDNEELGSIASETVEELTELLAFIEEQQPTTANEMAEYIEEYSRRKNELLETIKMESIKDITVELKISVEGIEYYLCDFNTKEVMAKLPNEAKKEVCSKLEQIIDLVSVSNISEQSPFLSTLRKDWLDLCEMDNAVMESLENVSEELQKRLEAKETILPAKQNIFKAFSNFGPRDVKVVILGEDPYVNANQATGYSFSVTKGINCPPSLRNIFKELQNTYEDFEFEDKNGDLSPWANQGVLLLNSILTVREKEPASHESLGWEEFTDFIISQISDKNKAVVFILWGSKAQQKEHLINTNKHLVLKGVHPSPATGKEKEFVNYKHFQQANEFLEYHGMSPIVWQL